MGWTFKYGSEFILFHQKFTPNAELNCSELKDPLMIAHF